MKRPSLVALVTLLPCLAFAQDATAPVNEVMNAVTENWKELGSDEDAPQNYVDYYSEDFLKRLYSKDFAAKYHEAAKYPAYEEGESPFDYDTIAMGQDGCPIKDLKIEAAPAANGVTDVKTTFDNTHCFGERAPDWKPAEVHFSVIEEDGRPVIDDILRVIDGTPDSLKKEMDEIAADGAKGGVAPTQEEDPE
ncbi:hypothetical protein [Sinorhizobium sp. BG8]|uniref:hypothetical protein n=1 Tax=Sinorhizobium sp. BG8 TaxID=2613773 RepID=UPI00193E92E2|nr:hypothetical protein [Sinorhizobium sp. BG8]QRM55649.1 hypothetical protein F3Y30_14790 [Sinorhizobium sp. BG8]